MFGNRFHLLSLHQDFLETGWLPVVLKYSQILNVVH